MATNVTDLVRRYFSAYQSRDRGAVEDMLADDFTFTSPYDDHIGRSVYFERCWPNSESVGRSQRIETITADGDQAFILYETELASGSRFRNTERFVFRDGKLSQVEVFFGDPPLGVSKETWRQNSAAATPINPVEAEIRGLVEGRAAAVRTKNVEAAMSHVAMDIVSFDVVGPLQNIGRDASRERTENWFLSFEGPVDFDVHELRIETDGNLGFCRSLNHVNATRKDGAKINMWWRATVCFRKTGDKWMVTHEHNSVPFDAESGKASLGLKPLSGLGLD